MPQWKFPPVRKEYPLTDPVQNEFFTTESIGGLTKALVREVIQNSLDARRDKGPVTICFNFDGIKRKASGDKANKYFADLKKHLYAENSGLRRDSIPLLSDDVPFVTIEDFGTSGLEGDVSEHDVAENDNLRHDFYWFWRNVGRSGKSKEELGRWGLGKSIFPALSQVNAFFGVSVRGSDAHCSLMGQCVLKTHRDKINMPRCSPYGYYGIFRAENGDEYYALPVEDENELQEFCSTFRLKRGTQPGLSIVIPFPYDDLQSEGVKEAVVQQWFWPILTDRLKVIIYARGEELMLDADSLENVVSELKQDNDSGSAAGFVRLAKWAIGLPGKEYVTLAPPSGRAPKWDDVHMDNAVRVRLQHQFRQGAPVAFRIRVTVREENRTPEDSYFNLYLQRDSDLRQGEAHCVRAGITIPNALRKAQYPQRGIRALLVVEDHPLCTFLGDAENPAHTEWQENSQKFRGKYQYGSSLLAFIKNSIHKVAAMLILVAEGIDKSILENIFYIDLPEREDKEEHEKNKTSINALEISSRPAPFAVYASKGGFKITRNPKAESPPKSADVKVAYAVHKGNPFSRYHELDFCLNREPIRVETLGVKITRQERNELSFMVTDDNFEINVSGFDPFRDVVIEINENSERKRDS